MRNPQRKDWMGENLPKIQAFFLKCKAQIENLYVYFKKTSKIFIFKKIKKFEILFEIIIREEPIYYLEKNDLQTKPPII